MPLILCTCLSVCVSVTTLHALPFSSTIQIWLYLSLSIAYTSVFRENEKEQFRLQLSLSTRQLATIAKKSTAYCKLWYEPVRSMCTTCMYHIHVHTHIIKECSMHRVLHLSAFITVGNLSTSYDNCTVFVLPVVLITLLAISL